MLERFFKYYIGLIFAAGIAVFLFSKLNVFSASDIIDDLHCFPDGCIVDSTNYDALEDDIQRNSELISIVDSERLESERDNECLFERYRYTIKFKQDIHQYVLISDDQVVDLGVLYKQGDMQEFLLEAATCRGDYISDDLNLGRNAGWLVEVRVENTIKWVGEHKLGGYSNNVKLIINPISRMSAYSISKQNDPALKQHAVTPCKNWLKEARYQSAQYGEAISFCHNFVSEDELNSSAEDLLQHLESSSSTDATSMEVGEKIFQTTCAACHGSAGEGIAGVFPPLNYSGPGGIPLSDISGQPRSVEGDLKIVREGRAGTAMPPFSDMLSEQDIVAVVKYIRNSWGNSDSSSP